MLVLLNSEYVNALYCRLTMTSSGLMMVNSATDPVNALKVKPVADQVIGIKEEEVMEIVEMEKIVAPSAGAPSL